MENKHFQKRETIKTTAEEIIFEEIQIVWQINFSKGAQLEEDGDALRKFIEWGRKKIQNYLDEKRITTTAGMNQYELKVYNAEEKIVLARFDYLFVHPETNIEYLKIPTIISN